MKKRFITMFVFLLIACLMLTGCSTGENTGIVDPTNTPETEVVVTEEPVETEEPASTEDEMYSYEVGGVTLKLRTKIEDYITDEGYFRYTDLATELGWTSEGSERFTKIMVYNDEIYILFSQGIVSFGVLTSRTPRRDKFTCHVNFQYDNPDEHETYLLDDKDMPANQYYLTMEELAVTVYILENYMNDCSIDFLVDYFEKPTASNYYVYN